MRRKRNLLEQLRHYLERGTLADRTLYWSGVTDPYAVKRAVTAGVWELLNDCPPELRPRRIVIQSRFRPDRDAAAVSRYASQTESADGRPAALVSYSIGTDRNDLIHAWERATPTFEQRLSAIERLRSAGVFVVPTLSPFGIWNDLERTLDQFSAWGIAFLTVLFFKAGTHTANTPRDFRLHLEREYPFLLDPEWQEEQIQVMRAHFGADRVLTGQTAFASLAQPPFG